MQRKNLHLLLRFLLVGLVTFTFQTRGIAQTTVEISSNPGFSQNIVTGAAAYHVGEELYLSSEIGDSMFTDPIEDINRIEFNVNTVGDPYSFGLFNVYLKEVTDNTLSAGTFSTTGYTLVYSGYLDAAITGWVGVDLTTTFNRTPGTNLQVLVTRLDASVPTTPTTWNASRGNGTSATAIMTRRYNGAAYPIEGTTALTTSAYRPAIRFQHVWPLDAALTDMILPQASCFNGPDSVSIELTDAGSTDPIYTYQAQITLTIRGANPYIGTRTNQHSLGAGQSGLVTFESINFSNPGIDTLTAIVDLSNAYYSGNDTITRIFVTKTLTTFPQVEGFETASVPLLPFKVSKDYFTTYYPSLIWRQQVGPYDSAASQNPTRRLAPHSGNAYYLFDAYNYSPGGEDIILYSPCMTLPAATQPNLSFYMSHDTLFQSAGYRDSIYIVVSTDKRRTWNRIASFARINASYPEIGWQQHFVNLSSYAGRTVEIGFEGISHYGNIIGLDDFTVSTGTTLPINLVDLKGEHKGSFNNLLWNTAGEQKNAGFELQRSADGVNFSKLAYVASKAENGTTGTALSYSYVDNTPLTATNYYRLKQIDKDGKVEYSKIVLLRNAAKSFVEIVEVYPNPTISSINVVIVSPVASNATIVVSDVAGKVVFQKNIRLNSGDNNTAVNVQSIATGIYNLRVVTAEGTSNVKFVKQ